MENQVWYHVAHPSLRYTRGGTFHPTRPEIFKCYRPNVRKVTPGSYVLHHLVNHTFQHTSTHILGPLAGLGGIPMLRRSFLPENGCLWAPAGLPP